MKHTSTILALILTIAMLASLMTACGEKADTGSGDTASTSDDGGSTAAAVAGSEQTWGEITVFVPDSMNMQGGNGTFEPDDQQTLWLHSKEAGTNYIEVMIVDSEDDAKSSLDTTKTISKEYAPADLTYVSSGTGQTWNGIEYEAMGYHCVSLYTCAGDKVYYIISAGYTTDSGELPAVLDSLK